MGSSEQAATDEAACTDGAEAGGGLVSRQVVVNGCLILVWFSCAAVVTLVNKVVTGESDSLFPYPIAFTSITSCFVAVLASAASFFTKTDAWPMRLSWRDAWIVNVAGMLTGGGYTCTNKALASLTVSQRSMLLPCSVVIMMLLSFLWGVERPSLQKMVIALLVLVGGMLQSGVGHHGAEGDQEAEVNDMPFEGALLVTLSMVMVAQQNVLVQLATQGFLQDCRLNALPKLEFAARISSLQALVSVIATCFFESEGLAVEEWGKPQVLFRSLCVGMMVVGIIVSELALVHRISAVAVSLLSSLHTLPIILSGVVFLGDRVGLQAMLGFALCICGSVWYAWLRNKERQAAAEPPCSADKEAEASLQPVTSIALGATGHMGSQQTLTAHVFGADESHSDAI